MCWVSWSKLAKSKREGEVGFRIQSFNDALLAKQSWRIINKPEGLLSRVLCGKYCHETPFLEVQPTNSCSHG